MGIFIQLSSISAFSGVSPLAFLQSFMRSDLMGKAVVLALIGISVKLWTSVLNKRAEIKAAQQESRRFVIAFRGESHPLKLFLARTRFDDSPLYQIYHQGSEALANELAITGSNPDDLFITGLSGLPTNVPAGRLKAVQNVLDRSVTSQALKLQNGMSSIATIVSLAPFLGLFGTVVGVMTSFNKMAGSGTVLLGEVAPGISSALLTTVVGLVVAMPAMVFYNQLTDKIRTIIIEMDHFGEEFMAEIDRHFRRNG